MTSDRGSKGIGIVRILIVVGFEKIRSFQKLVASNRRGLLGNIRMELKSRDMVFGLVERPSSATPNGRPNSLVEVEGKSGRSNEGGALAGRG